MLCYKASRRCHSDLAFCHHDTARHRSNASLGYYCTVWYNFIFDLQRTQVDRGRPRQFDEQTALHAAMQVFWRDGYRGASINALTDAMGINKPSLYAAFGDKRALYLRALDHYVETEAAAQVAALDSSESVRDAVSSFLKVAAARACNKALPGGCYIVNAMSDCGTDGTPQEVTAATQRAFQLVGASLRNRFQAAKRRGDLPPEADVAALANYFAAVMAGATLLSRNGASRAALNAIINQSLSALPVH